MPKSAPSRPPNKPPNNSPQSYLLSRSPFPFTIPIYPPPSRPEKHLRLPSPFRNPTLCPSMTSYKTAAQAPSRTTLSKKICQTKKHAPRRYCTNETPPSPSRTAEHSCCVSSEPQNGLPSASPPEAPLPPSPTTSSLFS